MCYSREVSEHSAKDVIGLSPRLYRRLIAIEGIPEKSHHLTVLGYISQFLRQVQQAYLIIMAR